MERDVRERLRGSFIAQVPDGRGIACRAILEESPAWTGRPDAIDAYAAFAETADVLTCATQHETLGIAVLRETSADAIELHLLAVRPAFHRRGVGARLVESVAAVAAGRGKRYVTVKTCAPSREGDDAPRRFFEAAGFEPVDDSDAPPEHACPSLRLRV